MIGPGAYALVGTLFTSQPIDIGGQPGLAAPVIQDTPASNISIFGAHLHDVHIEGSGEVSLSSMVADRIFVSYSGAGIGHTACLLNPGTTLRNSVCWAHDGASANSALRELSSGVASPVTLRNDTLITTAAAAPALQLEVGNSGSKASIEGSNVIARSVNHADVEAIVASGPATATVALNHSNYGTVSQVGAGATVTAPSAGANQTGFPAFAGPATGDFREAAGSPTIDAGVASPLEDTVDLLGNPRSLGLCIGGPAIPDIGAYEFASIPCPGPTPPASPSNKFKLGKLTLNKKKGTATLLVNVPGAGTLTLAGKGVKKVSLSAKSAGTLKLLVKALGKAKKGLAKTGKAKLSLKLTFAPGGGVAATQSEKVKLVKNLP
ncbi:MAG TPA: choice-of-anchor Q domain-containing protein [Solirubrobacterales bacterium]